MAQINPRSFADAQARADGIYELILTNWGNRGARQDPNNGSIQYPPVKSLVSADPEINGSIPIVGLFQAPEIPSLFGIAISPKSDIDRCILHLPSLPQTPSAFPNADLQSLNDILPDPIIPPPFPQWLGGGHGEFLLPIEKKFVNYGGILESEQILSVGAPLVGQLLGPIIVRAYPGHYYSDDYLPLGTTTEAPYGTAVNASFVGGTADSNGGTWTNPELRLLLYFNSKGVLPPQKRAPFHREYRITQTTSPFFVAAPMMGRKHVRVSVRGQGAPVFNVQLTGTFVDIGGIPPLIPNIDNFEVEMVAPVTIPSNQSAVLSVENPGLSFLLVKTTFVGGNPNVRVSIDMFD